MQARTDSTRGRCGGGRDDRAGGVAVGAIESGLEAADEDAGAGLREVVGGLVGGGNVGQADGAVADHLLPQPVKLTINVMELLRGSGGGSVSRHPSSLLQNCKQC